MASATRTFTAGFATFIDHTGRVQVSATYEAFGAKIDYKLFINKFPLKENQYSDYPFYGVKHVTINYNAKNEIEITAIFQENLKEVKYSFNTRLVNAPRGFQNYYQVYNKTLVVDTPKPVFISAGAGAGAGAANHVPESEVNVTLKAATIILEKKYGKTPILWSLYTKEEGVFVLFQNGKDQSLFWHHSRKAAEGQLLTYSVSKENLFMCDNPKVEINALDNTINGKLAKSTLSF